MPCTGAMPYKIPDTEKPIMAEKEILSEESAIDHYLSEEKLLSLFRYQKKEGRVFLEGTGSPEILFAAIKNYRCS
jgi:hypothetical protein